ncbi:hypothetical protein ABLB84_11845 [Xenorhabdus szentirmaii]|uniref:hypothetical protein n=1 Tax=Xenorhabdus szentirmaii TaxID=290112 RepID=UPI0032B71135
MGWNIPDIPQKKILSYPNYKYWVFFLILLLSITTLVTLFAFDISLGKVFLFIILPILAVWLCVLGFLLNKYERSVMISNSWDSEINNVKELWRSWSKKQLAIVGNVILTPEKEGMKVLLEELKDIPAYPKKARPLFDYSLDVTHVLKAIDNGLEKQCSGYRHYLYHIYVLQTNNSLKLRAEKAIFAQWDLVPIFIDSLDEIENLYDEESSENFVLLMTLQNWSGRSDNKFSELVSAQLIASQHFINRKSIYPMAALGRIMPICLSEINDDLDMLFEFNQLDKKQLQYVWLTGNTHDIAIKIMQYAAEKQWLLPNKLPLRSLDYSFGPASKMSFPLSLAMLVEAVSKTGKNQLVFSLSGGNDGYLCLVTRGFLE